MTVNEIFERAIALIDGITDTGVVDVTKTADYKARTPFLVNLFQMELIKSGDLFVKYSVSSMPFTNILLGGDHFSVAQHIDTDVTIETADGDIARMYYFESDALEGSATIEDYTTGWNTLTTIPITNTGVGYVPYKALVTPTAGATKSRIVFSGSYYYRFKNVALHSQALKNISEYSTYGANTKITMPSTCHSIKDVIFKSYKGNYEVSPEYKVERTGNLWEILFSRDFDGEVLITYIPNPTKVTTTALSETVTIDDYSADIMAYMLAESFMNVDGNDYLSNIFRNKYQQLIAQSSYRKAKPVVKMINKYGSV
jgi:hypothetical protein